MRAKSVEKKRGARPHRDTLGYRLHALETLEWPALGRGAAERLGTVHRGESIVFCIADPGLGRSP